MNETEIAYIQRISSLKPNEIESDVLHADEEEARVLRIYLGAEQFDRIRILAEQSTVRGEGQKKRGNVVVLHGIMGGQLSEFGVGDPSSIWVQILKLIAGKFDRLALGADGKSLNDIRPSGIYLRFYGSLLVSLNQEWNVQPFFYDWRRDIRFAALDLNAMLTSHFPGEPVHLVAHSMGGLVARTFIANFPERWNVAGPDGKRGNLVMLGTPNYGSFAIPRLLLGTNDVLSMLAKIDLKHDTRQMVEIAKTFQGAYQMMPAKGHIDGLDILYKTSTYTLTPVPDTLLQDALKFQNQIVGAIEKDRMVYVAGFNRITPAAIKDVTQLANDNGYVLSKRGDGTVPHDLGLLDGVKTFFVDEEHAKLPSNARVQAAMNALLETCDQPNENNLRRTLGPEFEGERGAGEDQAILLASQTARRAVKEQQVAALRNSILSRGALDAETVSEEQQALADALLQHDPLRLSLAGQDVAIDTHLPEPESVSATTPTPGQGKAPGVPDQQAPAKPVSPVTVAIRMHVLSKDVKDVGIQDTNDPLPIDCIAVGHYLRVLPTGAERDLGIELASALNLGTTDGGLFGMLHERGVLRGDLGVPWFLPDPRKEHANNLIAVAGMGPAGHFGIPELSLVARELCWTVAQLGKKHLATTMIGAGSGNLSYADAVHGWFSGIARALISEQSQGPRLEAITFVIWPKPEILEPAVNALKRQVEALPNSPLNFLNVQLMEAPEVKPPRGAIVQASVGSTRISVEYDVSGLCKYSALTNSASIPERVFKIDPRRFRDASTRMLQAKDPMDRYKLGKFLLEFLFPRDLRAQLTGSAPVVLLVNNEAAKVYWEMAAQPLADDDPIKTDDLPFLGLQRGLTRQLRTVLAPPPEPPPPMGRTLRILLVADGNREAPLPGAVKEAQMLTQLFRAFNAANEAAGNTNRVECTALVGPSKATTLDVLMKIADVPPFDVMHYAGHCVFDEKNPERSGLLFSGDDRLTAGDLDRVDRTPRFVFANACQSGIMPSRPELASPEIPAVFAEAFFKKGVANIICTAWPVADAPAATFAQSLYCALLGVQQDNPAAAAIPGTQAPASLSSPLPMYEAVRAARRAISNTTTWGAYQHYGDPHFRFFR